MKAPLSAVLGRRASLVLAIAPREYVKAVKPKQGFSRAIGSEKALIAKAAAMDQHWLHGLNVARSLQS